jgi:O-antigen/teichoic acid export membrane protein
MPPLARQGGWALLDQVLSSATNFATSLVVARLLAPAAFGRFALATAAWMTLLGLSRAAFVQPYVVEASRDGEGADWKQVTKHASGAVVVCGAIGGLALAIVGVVLGARTPTGEAFLILSVLTPFLLVQDFWRFAAFSRRSARTAAGNDALWALVQVGCLALVLPGHRTPGAALACWGAGAAAGAALGTLQFRLVPSFTRGTYDWARRIGRWGRWFGLANGFYAGGTQVVSIIVAAGTGSAGLGGLRGVQTLLGPGQLVAQSADAISLPAASRRHAVGGGEGLTAFAVRYGIILTAVLGGYGLILMSGGGSLLRLALGPSFAKYDTLILPLSLGMVATAWSLSASVALRSTLAGRQLAQGEALGAAAKIVFVALLVSLYGVQGAAWGVFVGSAMHSVALWWMYRRRPRKPDARRPTPDPVLDATRQ